MAPRSSVSPGTWVQYMLKYIHAYTGNYINSLKLSSKCKSASKAVPSRMQLTLHATRQTPRGASRLVQANACLVGENPTCSVPAL